jgi:hypothetical protein
MSQWMFSVENQYSGLGKYDATQSEHWQLDYVIDLCAQNGISVMLCFDYANAFNIGGGWPENPYNTYDEHGEIERRERERGEGRERREKRVDI